VSWRYILPSTMSWSIKIIGSRAAVKAAVNKESYLPQGLKDVVTQIADAPSAGSQDGLIVESHGHVDASYGGSVSKFEVSPITLATTLAPEPAAGAPASAPPP
jgi:hypothetical protein